MSSGGGVGAAAARCPICAISESDSTGTEPCSACTAIDLPCSKCGQPCGGVYCFVYGAATSARARLCRTCAGEIEGNLHPGKPTDPAKMEEAGKLKRKLETVRGALVEAENVEKHAFANWRSWEKKRSHLQQEVHEIEYRIKTIEEGA